MIMRWNRIVMMICAVALFSGLAWGEELIRSSDLKRMGLNGDTFNISAVSASGRKLVGIDRASKAEMREGYFFRIHCLELDRNFQVKNHTVKPVEGYVVNRVTWMDDEKNVLFVTNEGLNFYKLNTQTGDIKPIMTAEHGQGGFRAENGKIWSDNGVFYSVGQFYDEKRNLGPHSVVTFNPNTTGRRAFTPKASLMNHLTKKNKTMRSSWVGSDDMAIFVYEDEQGQRVVKRWSGESAPLKTIDTVDAWINSWGNSDRVIYSVDEVGGGTALKLYDGATDQTNVLFQSDNRADFLTYVLLSGDGTRALATEFGPSYRVKLYQASEQDGWKLKPIEGAEKVPYGRICMNQDGSVIALRSKKGIHFFRLP